MTEPTDPNYPAVRRAIADSYRWRFDCASCRGWILIADAPSEDDARAKAIEWGWTFGERTRCSRCRSGDHRK